MRPAAETLISQLCSNTGDQASLKGPEWRVSLWRGEFIDPRSEAGYRQHVCSITALQLRWGLAVWALLLLVFALPDYSALGWSTDFVLLLVMRLAVVGCIGLLYLQVRRTPMHAVNGVLTTLVESIGLAGFMLVFFLRPEIVGWTFVVVLLMLFTLFVAIPNRLGMALAVALFGAIITLVAMHLVRPRELLELLAMFLVLLLPVATGWISAWRVQVLQRQQYALMTLTLRSNRQLQDEVEQRRLLQQQLQRQASTDALTGLYNRHEYERLFVHELARSLREQQPLSLAILDLDHFKRVNDTYGHAAGDEVLRRVARLCRENFRAVDIVGRLGGEEFVVLLPDTALAQAGEVAQRVLEQLRNTPIEVGEAALQVTATLGLTQLQPGELQLDSLLQRADQALYAGKAGGRDRVVLAQADGSMQMLVD